MRDKDNNILPALLYAYVKGKQIDKEVNKPKLTEQKRIELRKKRKKRKINIISQVKLLTKTSISFRS